MKKRLCTVDFLFLFSVTNSNPEVVFLSIIYLKHIVVCDAKFNTVVYTVSAMKAFSP
jgi:hypothetical protein